MTKFDYQWQANIDSKSAKNNTIDDSQFGYRIIKRGKNKKLLKTQFRVYFPAFTDIYIVGEFNNWKKHNDYKLFDSQIKGFKEITLDNNQISHKGSYLFLSGDSYLRDPFSRYFDNEGNSVLWDFEDPSTYKSIHNHSILANKSLRILQTDLQGLVTHFKDKNGRFGHEVDFKDYYKFIAKCGVIEKIKVLGFNAIQFLPISQSIDGDKWSYRYLTPYLSSLNKKWGNPDEFKALVDTFHKNKISVILDLVISHFPHKDYNLFFHPAEHVGLQLWDNLAKKQVFAGDKTSWGTTRYNISDKNIQKFLIDSAVKIATNYNIDGFRIDNVDGIIRRGKNGDGDEKPSAREFLKKFNENLYRANKNFFISFESHYYFENNAKWLVSPLNSEKESLGASAYSDSRLSYFFHKDFMPKSADEISPWTIQHIIDEKSWGKSESSITDFHNHDAAAGLMAERATGSYAYDALTLNKKTLHIHAVGKIKVMESIISLCFEGKTLDLLQSHILQTGSFEHDSTIHWDLINSNVDSLSVLNYKKEINKLLSKKEFWIESIDYRKVINIDEKSKTIVLFRSTKAKPNSGYLIFINMSAFTQSDYYIPVTNNKKCSLILNSDELNFNGSGTSIIKRELIPEKTDLFEYFPYGIKISKVAPYQTLVFKI